MKVINITLAAILISALAASAEEARKIAFRTLCLERAGEIESVLIPGASADESQEIQLYTDLSPVVEGTFTGKEATFFIEKPGPDGEPVRELVGKAPLRNSDRQLFVFDPADGKAGGPAYVVRSFDDDTRAFPMGSIRTINLSPASIRFQISGQTTPAIPAGRHVVFPHSKKVNDYNMYPVVVEFLNANGKWIKGQSVSWKASDERREIVVTTIHQRFKKPVVRMFSDVPPWLSPEP